jgi:hypothetical protein
MYKLPKSFDLSVFKDRNLRMVCFGIYQFYLHFSDDPPYTLPPGFDFVVPTFPMDDKQIMITVNGEFSHQTALDSAAPKVKFPLRQTDLTQLLEHKVLEASVDDEGTLILKFDHGHVLKCFEDPAYESYFVRFGGHEMII